MTSFGIALTAIFAALVVMGSPIVIDLFINESFAGAMVFLPPLAILFAGKLMGEMANLGCYVGKTTWTVMAIDLVSAGVSIVAMYLLSTPYGIDGVIAALLIAQVVRMLSFYFVSQRVLYLHYALGKLAVLIAICVALSYVSLQIDEFQLQNRRRAHIIHRLIFQPHTDYHNPPSQQTYSRAQGCNLQPHSKLQAAIYNHTAQKG